MRYFVRLMVDGQIKLSTYEELQHQPRSQQYLEGGQSVMELRLFERRRALGGVYLFDGLFVDLLVEAEDLDMGIAKASSHVGLLLSLMALATPAEVGRPVLWMAYEAADNLPRARSRFACAR